MKPAENPTNISETNDGKQILRDVMSNYVPTEITEAKKQGFSSPDILSWFKGESIDFVKNTLCSKKAQIYDLFDFESVNQLLTQHFNGEQNRRLLIWSLLNFKVG